MGRNVGQTYAKVLIPHGVNLDGPVLADFHQLCKRGIHVKFHVFSEL